MDFAPNSGGFDPGWRIEPRTDGFCPQIRVVLPQIGAVVPNSEPFAPKWGSFRSQNSQRCPKIEAFGPKSGIFPPKAALKTPQKRRFGPKMGFIFFAQSLGASAPKSKDSTPKRLRFVSSKRQTWPKRQRFHPKIQTPLFHSPQCNPVSPSITQYSPVPPITLHCPPVQPSISQYNPV